MHEKSYAADPAQVLTRRFRRVCCVVGMIFADIFEGHKY